MATRFTRICGSLSIPALAIGLASILAAPVPARALGRETLVRRPLEVVSMYTPEIHKKWKAAHALRLRCPKEATFSDDLHCPTAMAKRESWRLGVFEAPNPDSEKKGEIELRLSPRNGLEVFFHRPGKHKAQRFPPTFRCKFMESDCVAEQSVVDVKEDWIQLPEGPMVGPGWINIRRDLGAPARVRPGVIAGRSYVLARAVRATKQATGQNQFLHRGEEIFVKRIENGALIVRMAQTGDDKCAPPKPALGEEPPEYALHISELYDGKGQMRIAPAYADYCPGHEKSEEAERNLKL